jgi:hypothetical protein
VTESRSSIVVQLPTGTATVEQTGGAWPVEQLLGVAARRGARRPFLLVSKVLGKHLPVTPTGMAASHEALAAQLSIDLPGPVLFVGMGETATGLGWGIYEAWSERASRGDRLYVHSTRYLASGLRTIAFEEAHSHAPGQAVCVPRDPALASAFRAARTLVVVDDELTSGKTAAALASALRAEGLPLERTVAIALVGAYPDEATREGGALFGWTVASLARIHVHFEFSGSDVPATPLNQRTEPLTEGVGSRRWGREGATMAPPVPEALVDALVSRLHREERVVVLGAGECMHPAFALGRALEARGFAVFLQSTTRSPIALGGAIGRSLDCDDGLGSGVPFYLHNPPSDDARVLVLHEPGAGRAAEALAQRLGGEAVEVWGA